MAGNAKEDSLMLSKDSGSQPPFNDTDVSNFSRHLAARAAGHRKKRQRAPLHTEQGPRWLPRHGARRRRRQQVCQHCYCSPLIHACGFSHIYHVQRQLARLGVTRRLSTGVPPWRLARLSTFHISGLRACPCCFLSMMTAALPAPGPARSSCCTAQPTPGRTGIAGWATAVVDGSGVRGCTRI